MPDDYLCYVNSAPRNNLIARGASVTDDIDVKTSNVAISYLQ